MCSLTRTGDLNSELIKGHLLPEQLLELPNIIQCLPITKRKEEQLKLVLNWGFKYLQDRFLEAQADSFGPVEPERLFYEHYFGQIARERNIELIKFYKPSFNQALSASERSFNTAFMRHIELSKSFTADFSRILNEEIYAEQAQVIESRIHAIIAKWEARLLQTQNSDAAVQEICLYIKKSRKFKFPWTFREIESAVALIRGCLNFAPAPETIVSK